MITDTLPLGKILETYSLCIPAFQRDYLWTSTHVSDLLTSLEGCLPEGSVDPLLDDKAQKSFIRGEVLELSVWTLGGLIVKRRSLEVNDKRGDVVDGQQRLTTLCLILAALEQMFSVGTYELIIQPSDSMTGEDETPRLTLKPSSAWRHQSRGLRRLVLLTVQLRLS